MIKKFMFFIFILLCVWNLDIKLGYAQEMSRDEMLKELHELKGKMKKLENTFKNQDNKEIDDLKTDLVEDDENQETPKGFKKYFDSVELSGTVEVEAVYERLKTPDAEPEEESDSDADAEAEAKTEKSSDLILSSVELGIDAQITRQVKTQILFSYEQGKDVI